METNETTDRPAQPAKDMFATVRRQIAAMVRHREVLTGVLCLAFISAVMGYVGKGPRVGDGHEYFAMYYAFATECQPYVTADVVRTYEAEQEAHPVERFASSSVFSKQFLEKLQVTKDGEVQQDFPHFWFYSLLAAFFSPVTHVLGLGATTSFLLLHTVLLWFAAMVCYRYHGWPGLLAFAILWLASPIAWYTNKVHTELFTFAVGVAAMAFAGSRRYLAAGFCMAVLSTQNPLWGALAVAATGWHLIVNLRKGFRWWEFAAMAATGGVLALHPVYYLTRYEVVTPQFLTGAAGGFMGLDVALVALADPQLGLLPNWPIGVVLLLAAVVLAIRGGVRQVRVGLFVCLFVALWVAVSLYSHGSTGHQDHGAILYASRYGTWYIPLFLPLAVVVIAAVRRLRYPARWGVVGAAAALALISASQYWPQRKSDPVGPTPFARTLLHTFPSLYRPYPQVFIQRFAVREGRGDIWEQASFVEPVSRLALVPMGWRMDGSVKTEGAGFPNLLVLLSHWSELKVYPPDHGFAYVRVPESLIGEVLHPDATLAGTMINGGSKEADQLLKAGWGVPEGHGRWSTEAAVVEVDPALFPGARVVVLVGSYFRPGPVDIRVNGALVNAQKQQDSGLIAVDLPTGTEPVRIELKVGGAVRPMDVVPGSRDTRMLGFFVKRIVIVQDTGTTPDAN